MTDRASFTCPRCGCTSYHPVDQLEGYCGACHEWTGPGGWRPLPRPAYFDEFPGEWVAVKNGRVVAHAASSRDLVPLVRALGEEGRDAVVERCPAPGEPIWSGWVSL